MIRTRGAFRWRATALFGLLAVVGPLGCGSTSKNGGANDGATNTDSDASSDGSAASNTNSTSGNAEETSAGGGSGASAPSGQGGTGTGGSTGSSGGATSGQGGSAGGATSSGVGGGGGADDACDCAQGDLQCAIRCAGSTGVNSGDCKGDGDCDGDGSCVELSPGGYRVCAREPTEFTACGEGSVYFCCANSDCEGGRCTLYSGATCEEVAGEPYAVCATDQCQTADDCNDLENGVCFPAGAYGRIAAGCVAGACRTDADCSDEANGLCLPVRDPCCRPLVALTCVYEDGCRTGDDCPDGNYCQVENGRAFCSSERPVCQL